MRGQRAFLEQHALQSPPVIFEQFGGPEVARHQHRVPRQTTLRGGAHPPADDPHQPVRQVLKVVHPFLEERIVDLAHAGAGALLDALDRGLGGQPAVDRLIDPPRPAFVVGEHLVGRENLLMLAGGAELGVAGHRVDLLAHPPERRINARAFGLGIIGDGVLDQHLGMVENRHSPTHPGDQLEPRKPLGAAVASALAAAIDEARAGDHLAQHHRHGLERLDLDILVAARLGVLNRQHPDRAFAPHDRHPGEAVEGFLAGLGAIDERRVARGLGKVEDPPFLGDRPDQPLAKVEPSDVNGFLVEPVGGEQLERIAAHQID